ncbi:winged helix-turn-helix domain-containing protein [Mesorhizobium qingshengii]|uniref:winged helix-turn-helix domain-containing protein n=1 Tax=Mesorhizobium qingshengii TaxID=1165689 RepID=UPI000B82AF2A|nr:helix-turn-helix domain-containing protein [Mesorhizobium qingshengii]
MRWSLSEPLAKDTRLEVFQQLVRAGPEGIPAGEIASRLGTVQNTMSTRLKVRRPPDLKGGTS